MGAQPDRKRELRDDDLAELAAATSGLMVAATGGSYSPS